MDRIAATAQTLAVLAGAQHNRLLTIEFPRGDRPRDAYLLVNRLRAFECLSKDFRFEVELLSDNPHISLKSMMGKMVTIALVREDGSLRHFNGYVTRFSLRETDGGFVFYDMVLGPWLHLLSLRRNCRVFHRYSVVALTEETFKDYLERDWRNHLAGDYPVVTLSNQYNETDHNHLHRRWEEHGIYYWYEHRADGHTLCLGDNSDLAPPIDAMAAAAAPQEIPFRSQSGSGEDDGIHQWRPVREVRAARTTLGSFDFKDPAAQQAGAASAHAQGADVAPIEAYEFAGAYAFRDLQDGERLAGRRMEETDGGAQLFEADGNDRCVQPGRLFTLGEHFSADRPHGPGDAAAAQDVGARRYLILEAVHAAANNYHVGAQAPSSYHNSLRCLKADRVWRPGRGHHSTTPIIAGVQTATVVGPAGSEIHTDEYGRIKVQFHWDRLGKLDEHSSPWVRVMTSWAGSGFGQISLPRVGQEVVLQFLDGNVDRPLVVGSVYNARHMPPWELPANKTQSGILTRSTRQGQPGMANALRFDDEAGKEQLWLHAERDQLTEVEHDEVKWVGNDRRKTVDRDEVVEVKHDRTETVGHDERITVHNDRTERVGRNEEIDIGHDRTEQVGHNESLRIGGHQRERVALTKEESIGLGKALTVGAAYQITVGGLMNTSVALAQSEQVGLSKSVLVGAESSLTAQTEHRMTVGGSEIVMTPGRIEITADEIVIRGRKKVEVHGDDVDLNPA